MNNYNYQVCGHCLFFLKEIISYIEVILITCANIRKKIAVYQKGLIAIALKFIKSIEMTFDDRIIYIYIDSAGNIYGIPSNRKDDFQYVSNFDNENRQGKIKSIANMKIEYFNKFDSGDKFGNISQLKAILNLFM